MIFDEKWLSDEIRWAQWNGEDFQCIDVSAAREMATEIARLRVFEARYNWLRKNVAWETEAFLGNITPEEYDEALIKRMSED